jgi:hypothetical protein
MLTGQAAGTAASLSIQDKCIPEQVNMRKLQDYLKKQGVQLPEGL